MASRLDLLVSVVLDGAGAAASFVGPVPAYNRWLITHAAVDGNSTTEPRLKIFRNIGGAYIDGTNTANLDTSEFPNPIELFAGEGIYLEWSTGTPGAAMSARIGGLIETQS